MLMTYRFTKYSSFIFDQFRKSKLSQRRPNWMVFASYCQRREMVMDDLTKKHQFEIWPTIMAEVGNDNFPPRRFLTSSQCGLWKTCVLRSHHQHILLSQSLLPSWDSVSVCVFICIYKSLLSVAPANRQTRSSDMNSIFKCLDHTWA